MEVNLASPTPAPPTPATDGDSPCRIDVADMAVDGLTLLVCLCGLLGNGAVLWLLDFCIRRNPITVYILSLAFADFTFLLFMVASAVLYVMENVCSTAVSLFSLRSLFLLSLFSYNMGLYLLTAISIERCVSVLYSSIRRPQCLSAMVVCALLLVLSIAIIAVVTSLCLWQDHEHCRVSLISMYVLNFLVFAPITVVSSIILFVKVQCGSQRRQPRRLYIVIFLSVLFFLLFALPLSIWNFFQQFGYAGVPSQVVFLLACIKSSANPFIYFSVGSCRRHGSLVSLQVAFQRVFEEREDNAAYSNDTMMDTLAPAC